MSFKFRGVLRTFFFPAKEKDRETRQTLFEVEKIVQNFELKIIAFYWKCFQESLKNLKVFMKNQNRKILEFSMSYLIENFSHILSFSSKVLKSFKGFLTFVTSF